MKSPNTQAPHQTNRGTVHSRPPAHLGCGRAQQPCFPDQKGSFPMRPCPSPARTRWPQCHPSPDPVGPWAPTQRCPEPPALHMGQGGRRWPRGGGCPAGQRGCWGGAGACGRPETQLRPETRQPPPPPPPKPRPGDAPTTTWRQGTDPAGAGVGGGGGGRSRAANLRLGQRRRTEKVSGAGGRGRVLTGRRLRSAERRSLSHFLSAPRLPARPALQPARRGRFLPALPALSSRSVRFQSQYELAPCETGSQRVTPFGFYCQCWHLGCSDGSLGF